MFTTKFIYDLFSRPQPTPEELDDEIDRLLYIKGAEAPNYLVKPEELEPSAILDSEVIAQWLRRKIEPGLLLLMLEHEDNYYKAKAELVKMDGYKSLVDRFLKPIILRSHVRQRVRETCFDDTEKLKLSRSIETVKKAINFLSKHLEGSADNLTLQMTQAYTDADIHLYHYLKRILVGKFQDSGLKSHIRLCEPVIKFMRRFAKKNTYIIDVTTEDPLAGRDESNLLTDATKPAMIVVAVVLFYLWRRG